mmetsp:Transcript_63705/g.165526  ORF Transcript_63705/g.165526 Transcript_63705/m.165526 type:complete len:107 (-) Transcript_63705:66-386(-)
MIRKVRGMIKRTMFAHHAAVVTAKDVDTDEPSTRPTGIPWRAAFPAFTDRNEVPAAGAEPPTKAPHTESTPAQSARAAKAKGINTGARWAAAIVSVVVDVRGGLRV